MFTFKVEPIHSVATLPISKLNQYKKNPTVHWHLWMAHFGFSCVTYHQCFGLPEAAIGVA